MLLTAEPCSMPELRCLNHGAFPVLFLMIVMVIIAFIFCMLVFVVYTTNLFLAYVHFFQYIPIYISYLLLLHSRSHSGTFWFSSLALLHGLGSPLTVTLLHFTSCELDAGVFLSCCCSPPFPRNVPRKECMEGS